MGYNTFPTLQGIGWNIKKRQLWSTNVEVAANGAEFRTGYWTSPLYEFDLSINYLSPTDKAALEAFYLQQQGPLIPFLLPIVNEGSVVTDQVFFTGNGTATTASLPIWPATVTAMHQTDWQGRVALSNQPRTNYLTTSEITTTGAGVSLGTPVAGPDGKNIAVFNAAAADWPWLSAPIGTVPAGKQCAFSFVAEHISGGNGQVIMPASTLTGNTGNATYDLVNGVATGGPGVTASITSLGSGFYLCSGGFTYSSGAVFSIYCDAYQQSHPAASVYAVGRLMLTDLAGVYIPTTTAPVTVTDYAVNTSGQVTFGQAPATGATVDTSGQSAYIVRFVDDQTGGNRQTSGNSAPLEINQFMNGMYEQTGITFRTVR